jgi:hypothetical protein
MTVANNTVQTFAMVGIKEDVTDVITLTDPMEVPFYSGIGKSSAKQRTPEHLIDSLAAPDAANANIEGDEAANDAGSQPVREKNVVQLMDKVVEVSSTAQAVDAYGREDEMAYQVVKKGKELKRDFEARATGNFASVLGNASTAGLMGGAEAIIKTNVSRGESGASGGYNSGTGLIVKATDGTRREATEAQLKDVIQQAWTRGGTPSTIMVGGMMKQKYSAFPGIATQYRDNQGTKAAVIIAAADVYKSDFGLHTILPNRFMNHGADRDNTWTTKARTDLVDANCSALVLDMSSWKAKFLQPMKTTPLAKVGHSDRKMLFCEWTLECSDEQKNGVVADIQVASG